MNGQRRGYMPMPQGGGGYNPYSKYPNIGGLARQFMQNMMQMQQMRQQQAQQEQQREQQEWQKEMTGKQFDLQKLKANIDLQKASRERRGEELQAKARWKSIEDIDKAVEDEIISKQQGFVMKQTGKFVSERTDEGAGDDKYTQRKNLMKSLRMRLNKEVTTLKQRSKPIKLMKAEGEKLTAGELTLIEAKKKATSQLTNIESALDFLGRMESSLESGAFGKRQAEALNRMMGNIGKLREGTLLDDIRSSWMEEAKGTPQAPTRKQFKNKKTGKLDWFRWDGSKWIKE